MKGNVAGFNLWRAQLSQGQYTDLTQLNSHFIVTTLASAQPLVTYFFEDLTARPGITYLYGLEQIDWQGLSTIHWEHLISTTLPHHLP